MIRSLRFIFLFCAIVFCNLCALAQPRTLTGGWYKWEPYNFVYHKDGLTVLSGLDVELVRQALHKEHHTLYLEQIPWDEQVNKIHAGQIDVVFGGLLADVDSTKVWVSQPYRWERMRLVYSKQFPAFKADNAKDLLVEVEKSNLRLGVGKGYGYGPVLDPFLARLETSDRLYRGPDEYDLFSAFKSDRIDGFLCDELIAETLAWNTRLYTYVQTHPLILTEEPVHVFFSKSRVPQEFVRKFDAGMAEMKRTGEYNHLIRSYLFPKIMQLTVETRWFYWVDIIGVVAAGISGLLFARKGQFSFAGTFVFVVVAALGGGLLRDIITQRTPNLLFRGPDRVYALLLVAFAGYYLLIKPTKFSILVQGSGFQRAAPYLLEIMDALGKAAFTVVGVLVALETKSEPLYLWGPLLAVLTSLGGGIVRDIVGNELENGALRKGYHPQIIAGWGLLLSLFFYWQVGRLQRSEIVAAIIITMVCVFLTSITLQLKEYRNQSVAKRNHQLNEVEILS